MPRKSYKIQEALQQRKQNEAATLDNLRVEETAYQCYFQPDILLQSTWESQRRG